MACDGPVQAHGSTAQEPRAVVATATAAPSAARKTALVALQQRQSRRRLDACHLASAAQTDTGDVGASSSAAGTLATRWGELVFSAVRAVLRAPDLVSRTRRSDQHQATKPSNQRTCQAGGGSARTASPGAGRARSTLAVAGSADTCAPGGESHGQSRTRCRRNKGLLAADGPTRQSEAGAGHSQPAGSLSPGAPVGPRPPWRGVLDRPRRASRVESIRVQPPSTGAEAHTDAERRRPPRPLYDGQRPLPPAPAGASLPAAHGGSDVPCSTGVPCRGAATAASAAAAAGRWTLPPPSPSSATSSGAESPTLAAAFPSLHAASLRRGRLESLLCHARRGSGAVAASEPAAEPAATCGLAPRPREETATEACSEHHQARVPECPSGSGSASPRRVLNRVQPQPSSCTEAEALRGGARPAAEAQGQPPTAAEAYAALREWRARRHAAAAVICAAARRWLDDRWVGLAPCPWPCSKNAAVGQQRSQALHAKPGVGMPTRRALRNAEQVEFVAGRLRVATARRVLRAWSWRATARRGLRRKLHRCERMFPARSCHPYRRTSGGQMSRAFLRVRTLAGCGPARSLLAAASIDLAAGGEELDTRSRDLDCGADPMASHARAQLAARLAGWCYSSKPCPAARKAPGERGARGYGLVRAGACGGVAAQSRARYCWHGEREGGRYGRAAAHRRWWLLRAAWCAMALQAVAPLPDAAAVEACD
jgi:hypothetical protein